MSITGDINNRQVIPRWLPFEITQSLGEINPLNKTILDNRDFDYSYLKKELDWINRNDNFSAIDYAATAYIFGDTNNINVINAAKHIIKEKKSYSKYAIDLANTILNRIQCDNSAINLQEPEIHQKISILKKRIIQYPYNSINWVDIAFYYAIIGQNRKAKRSIDVAVHLSPNNRFILRSAVRFYLHIGELDKALYIIKKSYLVSIDPWITSVEIALTQMFEKPSKFYKKGINLLASGHFSNFCLSELNCSVGTLHYNDGANKKAKKYIIDSLIDPTENAFTQAEWLSTNINIQITNRPNLKYLSEANTRKYLREGQFEKSLENAFEWIKFQPFCSRASLSGSYIATVCLDKFSIGIEISKKALIASPGNPVLINNLAFALCLEGQISEVSEAMKNIDMTKATLLEQNVITATKGLFCYKIGEAEKGFQLYSESVAFFKKTNELNKIAIALYYWGKAEIECNKARGEKILNESKVLSRKINLIEIKNKF